LLVRRILGPANTDTFPELMACLAGLLVICITESASITLRGPIMPILYWTLLGLSCALTTPNHPQHIMQRARSPFLPIALAIAAIAALVAAAVDLHGSVREALMTPADSRARPRLFGEKHLATRIKSASMALDVASSNPQPANVDRALQAWQHLYDETPGYGPVHACLARCLLLANRPDDARKVLTLAISNRTNPYDPKLNALLAELSPDDPMEQYRCAQRAARGGVPDVSLQNLLLKALATPAVKSQLEGDVQRARIIAQSPDDSAVRDAIVDTLRLSALAADRASRSAEGVDDQRRAADLYRTLEQRHSIYRRPHEAETDAFLQLSLYLFDPLRRYADACAAVKDAEHYAVLGIPHETLANPEPKYGYVIGEVMPTDFPESLRPLWRFSALLHLIVGDDRFLDYRIFFSLPPADWTQQNLKKEMAALAKQAYDAWTRLPADQRPKHYARLLEMSRTQ
jgi:hypothetical protein